MGRIRRIQRLDEVTAGDLATMQRISKTTHPSSALMDRVLTLRSRLTSSQDASVQLSCGDAARMDPALRSDAVEGGEEWNSFADWTDFGDGYG